LGPAPCGDASSGERPVPRIRFLEEPGLNAEVRNPNARELAEFFSLKTIRPPPTQRALRAPDGGPEMLLIVAAA
jgi:hypothetical protein